MLISAFTIFPHILSCPVVISRPIRILADFVQVPEVFMQP
jgi:hypothetical protein